jgi:hypothetical protein
VSQVRVTQKIVVGTISINSVQNSSIVQIGSSGMIQSQTESNGNNGTGDMKGAQTKPQQQPQAQQQMQPGGPGEIPSDFVSNIPPAAAPFAKPELSTPGVFLPPYVYGPPGPLGPVGGIGVTRNVKETSDANDHKNQPRNPRMN